VRLQAPGMSVCARNVQKTTRSPRYLRPWPVCARATWHQVARSCAASMIGVTDKDCDSPATASLLGTVAWRIALTRLCVESAPRCHFEDRRSVAQYMRFECAHLSRPIAGSRRMQRANPAPFCDGSGSTVRLVPNCGSRKVASTLQSHCIAQWVTLLDHYQHHSQPHLKHCPSFCSGRGK